MEGWAEQPAVCAYISIYLHINNPHNYLLAGVFFWGSEISVNKVRPSVSQHAALPRGANRHIHPLPSHPLLYQVRGVR